MMPAAETYRNKKTHCLSNASFVFKFRAELMACPHVGDAARESNRRQELQLAAPRPCPSDKRSVFSKLRVYPVEELCIVDVPAGSQFFSDLNDRLGKRCQ